MDAPLVARAASPMVESRLAVRVARVVEGGARTAVPGMWMIMPSSVTSEKASSSPILRIRRTERRSGVTCKRLEGCCDGQRGAAFGTPQ